jgi:hypothetical protein
VSTLNTDMIVESKDITSTGQDGKGTLCTQSLWEVIAPHLSASFTLDPSALTLG